MNYPCDLIADLLPLYLDKACSPASTEAVAKHLETCEACAKLYADMQPDAQLDQCMVTERNAVLQTQKRFFKRRSALIGCIFGGIFAIPILICLLINLASGTGLTWFFVVFAAMLLPVSLIVVPLLAAENKLLWTILTGSGSLLLLLAVCCLYTGGSWFWVAASSVLFGLSIPLMPFVVRAKPVAERIGNNKGLLLVGTYTITYVLMMLCIGFFVHSAEFFRIAGANSVVPLLFLWSIFALIRYPRWNSFYKAALCFLTGSLLYFWNDTIVLFLYNREVYVPSPVFSFATFESSNATISWLILLAGCLLAALFAGIGILHTKSHSKNKKEYTL